MNSALFIEANKQLTLEAYIHVASDMMSLIAEAAEGINEIDETYSVANLSNLLNKVSTRMSGKFEIRRTPSCYCQIVYEPYLSNESGFDEEHYRYSNSIDPHDDWESCLWISEKVLFAFIDQKLYGIAFILYFYLGYLMTRDESFAVSHNISFEKLVKSCDAFPEGWRVKHRTTLMRAIADLQDAGLIKWNEEAGTFELLYITAYDPKQKV